MSEKNYDCSCWNEYPNCIKVVDGNALIATNM